MLLFVQPMLDVKANLSSDMSTIMQNAKSLFKDYGTIQWQISKEICNIYRMVMMKDSFDNIKVLLLEKRLTGWWVQTLQDTLQIYTVIMEMIIYQLDEFRHQH